MIRKKTYLFCALTVLSAYGLHAEQNYGDKGCAELNGAAGLNILVTERSTACIFQTAFSVLMFPIDMVAMGVMGGISRLDEDDYHEGAYQFGLLCCLAYNKVSPVVFASSGIGVAIATVSIGNFGSGSAVGFSVPVTFGIKIPVKQGFLVSPQITYTFTKSEKASLRAIAYGIGFSGFKILPAKSEGGGP